MSRFLTDTLDGIEITRAEDVKKHGDHDQSSHGSWAHGISVDPEVVTSILNRVKENGGLSVKMTDGSEPTKGFMVAKGKKFAAIVKADDFYNPDKGAEILSSYMKQHKADLATGKNYLGLWHNKDDGQVYLDVSENIQDKAEATSRGRSRDQISIWDVANFKEIPTGGTGGIEKTRGSRTARFIEDDRRTNRRVRENTLGEIGSRQSTTKVIYFDFGLKPVIKHGDHDQSEHGNWARGYTDAERERIESMDNVGPSLEDLDKVISGKREVSDDEIKMFVENDRNQYESATEGIDERVDERLASLQEEFPNHEYTEQEKTEIYENVQNEMIDEYIESSRDDLEEIVRIESGDEGGMDPSELTPFFDEVYSTEHTGKDWEGKDVTLRSSVQEVYRDGDNIMVTGIVTNEDGREVGQISRRFFKEGDNWNVEHALLALDDLYRGTGFGKEFIQQSEAWYVSKGMGYIEVGTAWDGARHWARAGYDFRPDKIEENLGELANAVVNRDPQNIFAPGTSARKEFDAIMSRATNGYKSDSQGRPTWDSVKDMKSEGFPLPVEFANIGFTAGAKMWAGADLTGGLRMKYVKVLTPEGQKLLDGPIDHDGDGMIYDGTAREKPAPGSGKKD